MSIVFGFTVFVLIPKHCWVKAICISNRRLLILERYIIIIFSGCNLCWMLFFIFIPPFLSICCPLSVSLSLFFLSLQFACCSSSSLSAHLIASVLSLAELRTSPSLSLTISLPFRFNKWFIDIGQRMHTNQKHLAYMTQLITPALSYQSSWTAATKQSNISSTLVRFISYSCFSNLKKTISCW